MSFYLLILLIYLGTFYLLFEVIRRKTLLQKIFFFSVFLISFSFSLSIKSFISSKYLALSILEIGVIISAITFIVGMIIVFLKGDEVEKEKARNLTIVIIVGALFFLVIMGIAYFTS
jgi:hypothetical protein